MDHRGRQEGPLRSNDDQARLAHVERQLAALQAEVAQLKRRLTWPGEAGNELGNDRPSPAFSEVALTVFVAIDHQPPRTAVPDQSGIVSVTPTRVVTATPVVVVQAPPELQNWARGKPDPLVRHAESLLAGVKERLGEAVADQFVNVVWKQMNWQVTDFGGFAGAADLLDHLDSMAHRAVGAWLAELGRGLGVPGPIAAGAGAVEVELEVRLLAPAHRRRQTTTSIDDAYRSVWTDTNPSPSSNLISCVPLKSDPPHKAERNLATAAAGDDWLDGVAIASHPPATSASHVRSRAVSTTSVEMKSSGTHASVYSALSDNSSRRPRRT